MQPQSILKINEELQPADICRADTHSGFVAKSGRRDEQILQLCEAMIDLAAALFNVSSKDIRKPGRSSLDISRVRQVAMYVAHVVLKINMADIGKAFGRDRTTVLYACHLVEDLRDDSDFDRIITMTERVAAAALGDRVGH